jgi:glucan phosphorylase
MKQLAGSNEFNNTRLALNLSEYVNGVAVVPAAVVQVTLRL